MVDQNLVRYDRNSKELLFVTNPGLAPADYAELFRLAAELGREPRLDQLLLMILEKSRGWIKAEACSIFLPDQESGDLVIHSAHGSSTPQLSALRIPAGKGVVGTALQERKLIRVDDVSKDPRFYGNVDKKTGWLTKALVAAPLLDGESCVGVIEFLNPIGRDYFSTRDEEMIEYFSSLVAASLVRIKFNENAIERAQVQRDLDLAREMQEGLLPTQFPSPDGKTPYDLFAKLDPAYEVSGDLYDFFALSDGRICLVVGDVAGKGVGAGFFMAVTRTLIRAVALDRGDPVEILTLVNKQLCLENQALLFVTIILAIYDPATGELTYGQGGHNSPILLAASGQAVYEPPGGQPLGIFEEAYFGLQRRTLSPGDSFIIYTDGVTEAMNPEHKQFGDENLIKVLKDQAQLSSRQLTERMIQRVKQHTRDAEQSDDITILILKRL